MLLSLRNFLLLAVLALLVAGAGWWLGPRLARAPLAGAWGTVTVDETNPATFTNPVDDDCPVGASCKIMTDLDVTDDGAPLPALTTIFPGAFQWPDATSIPNGRTAGHLHDVAYLP